MLLEHTVRWATRGSIRSDGARHLRAEQWPEVIVNLVALHSGARFEAAERGLSDELAEFPFEVARCSTRSLPPT